MRKTRKSVRAARSGGTTTADEAVSRGRLFEVSLCSLLETGDLRFPSLMRGFSLRALKRPVRRSRCAQSQVFANT